MKRDKKPWMISFVAALIGAGLLAITFYWGYRTGSSRAFIRDQRLARMPDQINFTPAQWADTFVRHDNAVRLDDTSPPFQLPEEEHQETRVLDVMDAPEALPQAATVTNDGSAVLPEALDADSEPEARAADGADTLEQASALESAKETSTVNTEPETTNHDPRFIPTGAFSMDMARPARLTWPLDIGPDLSPDRPDRRLCLRARKGAGQIQNPGTATALYPFRIKTSGRYQTYFRVRWVWDGVDSVECNNSWFVGFNDDPLSVLGGEGNHTHWFWEKGPEPFLEAGVQWLRVEMRNDGPVMDRVWLAPADETPDKKTMDAMDTVAFWGFSGKAPPLEPQAPFNETEFYALPTRSLVIGATHTNELTVVASWQGGSEGGFEGEIEILFPTAPGVTLDGDRHLQCGPNRPFVSHTVRLNFPPETPRRSHVAHIRVKDEQGRVRFFETVRFFKPFAWAFLGPFSEPSRMGGDIEALFKHPADRHPLQLAQRKHARDLGVANLPLARGHTSREWKVVADGSCYNWSGALDLEKVYGRVYYAYAYAVTWIHAERLLHHRPFNLQLDDQGWLWMNNRFLVARAMDLPLDANRLWTSARLDMGKNPVVVKLTQKHKFWGFRLDGVDWHFEGRRGDVITGVDPENWPTGP